MVSKRAPRSTTEMTSFPKIQSYLNSEFRGYIKYRTNTALCDDIIESSLLYLGWNYFKKNISRRAQLKKIQWKSDKIF